MYKSTYRSPNIYRTFNINRVLAANTNATKIDEEIETSLTTRLSARLVCLLLTSRLALTKVKAMWKNALRGSELAGQ